MLTLLLVRAGCCCRRFGFREVPDGVFNQPAKDLLVLTDTFSSLRHLDWREMLSARRRMNALAVRLLVSIETDELAESGEAKGLAVETKALTHESAAGSNETAAMDTSADTMDTTDGEGEVEQQLAGLSLQTSHQQEQQQQRPMQQSQHHQAGHHHHGGMRHGRG